MKLLVGGVLAGIALALCSCKPQNTISVFGGSDTPAAPVTTGYLAVVGTSGVEFIQWADTAGTLSGTDQSVQISGQAPHLVANATSLRLSGTLNGTNLSLSLEGSAAPLFGTMSSSSFTLDVPQSNGTLAPITFSASSAAAYNSAVQALDQQVAQQNQQVAGAQAQQQTLASEQGAIDRDASIVTNGISALSQDEAELQSDLKSMGGDVHEVGTDLASAQQAAAQVASEAHGGNDAGSVCDDAGSVEDDAGGVSDDAGAVGDDGGAVSSDLSYLRAAVQQLTAASTKLQADESALPDYPPTPSIPASAVSQAVSTANAASAGAVVTANGYIDQANAGVTTAYGYALQAAQAGNCARPPAAPTPRPHIS